MGTQSLLPRGRRWREAPDEGRESREGALREHVFRDRTPLTRRFAAPSPGGRGELHFSYADKQTEPVLQRKQPMRWTGIYLVGYIIMLGGIVAALWKSGVLARIGTTWTIIGVVIAIGIGIMIAVANSGKKESINIEK